MKRSGFRQYVLGTHIALELRASVKWSKVRHECYPRRLLRICVDGTPRHDVIVNLPRQAALLLLQDALRGDDRIRARGDGE